ncbi:hypothetical protein AGMMS49546_35400 [Spirochaetia bacterium]|nr:hypothetical protein AGMMS49546_35400 [Spirochaetia bacterium]
MPGNTENVMFALRFAGGGFEDLYPYELFLEEGFSKTYRGELSVISGKLHTREELLELLDKKVSLNISQRLGDEKTRRTRWVHGIVTSVRSHGVFLSTKLQDAYWYVITIEPEIARLRYTRNTESFYKVNPVDIIEKLLNRYSIKGNFDQKYIDRRKYGQRLMFEQVETPVLDFIQNLLYLYGLSYTFCHPKAQGTSLGETGLYFSDGERFPLSDIAYTDNRKVPDSIAFDFLSKDEGQSIWKMDAWRQTDRIGTDGLELTASYPESGRGNHEWRRGDTNEKDLFHNYNRMFHGYFREAAEKEIDDDLKLILDARYRSMELAKTCWEGEAENLALAPGAMFDLSHFYGARDSAKLTALVSGIKLRARTVWPPNLAVVPGVAAEGELITLQAECIDFGKTATKRFCSGPYGGAYYGID